MPHSAFYARRPSDDLYERNPKLGQPPPVWQIGFQPTTCLYQQYEGKDYLSTKVAPHERDGIRIHHVVLAWL